MSAYASFFLKHNNDFIPLGDFCRSSVIFKTFDYYIHIPMEKITSLSENVIDSFIDKFEKDIRDNKEEISKLEKQIQDVYSFNNNVSEKMKYVCEIRETISNYEIDIEELQSAIGYLRSLIMITDANEENSIYCGIETPEKVTLEDVVDV